MEQQATWKQEAGGTGSVLFSHQRAIICFLQRLALEPPVGHSRNTVGVARHVKLSRFFGGQQVGACKAARAWPQKK